MAKMRYVECQEFEICDKVAGVGDVELESVVDEKKIPKHDDEK